MNISYWQINKLELIGSLVNGHISQVENLRLEFEVNDKAVWWS